jgi:site-specific DNA-methyltransferase (adenine-specific)
MGKVFVNKILQGDCLDLMKELDDNSIDHIISDWPFFGVVKENWDNQWENLNEYLEWGRKIIIEYKRIIKDNGNVVIFTGRQYNRYISQILDEHFTEKRIIIWSRKRGFNTSRGKALSSGYEPICYYTNGDNGTFNTIKIKPKTNRKEYTKGILKDGINLSDVWSDISALPHNSKEKLNHSTQKPYKLIERLVLMLSNEGDIILDNFAGSGTLGEVCMNTNRKCVLIEKEKEYYDIIQKRLEPLKMWEKFSG